MQLRQAGGKLLLYERTVAPSGTSGHGSRVRATRSRTRRRAVLLAYLLLLRLLGLRRLGSLLWLGSVHCDTSRDRPIAAARSDAVFLVFRVGELHADGSPPAIGVRLRVVTHKVQMREVFSDGGKGIALVLPALCKICLAAGAGSHSTENRGGFRVELGFPGADHIDRNAFGLRQFVHVLRRHHAGVVRSIREDYDDLPARNLGG